MHHRKSIYLTFAASLIVFGGCSPAAEEPPVPEPAETAAPLISAQTKEALLGLEIPPLEQAEIERGIADIDRALAIQDPALLINGLDTISLAILSRDNESAPNPEVLLWRDVLASIAAREDSGVDLRALSVTRSLRRAFLEWWYDAWLAQLDFEQIRVVIQSPFNFNISEDELRLKVRNQLTGVGQTDTAKEKVIDKLKDQREETRAQAEDLRAQGRDSEAQRLEAQLIRYDWAIDEVERLLQAP